MSISKGEVIMSSKSPLIDQVTQSQLRDDIPDFRA